jgi:hypothetical protein
MPYLLPHLRPDWRSLETAFPGLRRTDLTLPRNDAVGFPLASHSLSPFGPIPVEPPAEPKPKRTALDAVNSSAARLAARPGAQHATAPLGGKAKIVHSRYTVGRAADDPLTGRAGGPPTAGAASVATRAPGGCGLIPLGAREAAAGEVPNSLARGLA